MRPAVDASAAPASSSARGGWLGWLPALLAAGIASALLLPRVHQNAHLFLAVGVVVAALALANLALWLRTRSRGSRLLVEPVPPSRQHYIQACVQLCLYLYWGWRWQQDDGVRPIFAQAPLIVVQLAFAYAFDGLLAFARGRAWRLTSGPLPIVLSTNLFLWFRDDWFACQFAMIAAAVLGKEFVKWTRDGRRTHIFNPSGFGLACAASVLIALDATDITWAKPLATTLDVPGVFLFLFALGLVVQNFFQVTLMTMTAAAVMVAYGLVYTQLTGVYVFASTNLPAAAFLGLHLLMTDPSTSPRTNLGRTLFGAAYGLGYIAAFELLGRIGAPELYAKLYPVPVLNCCVQWLDRLARSGALGRLNARWENARPPMVMNRIHMGIWALLFAVLYGTGYLGDFQGEHPGNSIAFWKRAVAEGRHDAERKLVMVAGSQALASRDRRQVADAYNELGILSLHSGVDRSDEATRRKSAAHWWAQAAAHGSRHALENIAAHFLFDGARRSDQELDQALRALEQIAATADGRRAARLLALAWETGGGRPEDPARALELYRRCGDDLFAQKGIARIGLRPGSVVDLAPVAPVLAAAAVAGDGEACYYLAHMHALGRGVPADPQRARDLLARAAALGFPPAVEAQRQAGAGAAFPAYVAPRRKHLLRPPWSSAYAEA